MRRVTVLVVMILVVTLLLGACAAPKPSPAPPTSTPKPTPTAPASPTPSPTPKEQWPSAVVVAGGSSTTSSTYILGIPVSEIITKYVGVSASPVTWRGMPALASALQNKEVDIAHLYQGITAGYYRTDYELYGKIGSLRQLMLTKASWWHTIGTKDIKSLADLKGKRVMFLSPGSPDTEQIWDTILAYYGMTRKDIIPLPREGQTEQIDALKAGTTDVVQHLSSLKLAVYTEGFKSIPGLHLLAFEDALVKQIEKLGFGYSGGLIPVGSYPGQDKEVLSIWSTQMYAVHKDMPEGLAYAVTKALHEHLDMIHAAHPEFKELSLENSAKSIIFPIHPGAKKYYQERGVWTPELDKQNQAILDIIAKWK